MRVLGSLKFGIEAEGTEKGSVRGQGNYEVAILGLTMPMQTDVRLLKDDADVVIGLGGITTIKFIHIKAVFDDPSVANANVEFIVNDGSGDKTITGLQLMLVATDITSIKLTNNSDNSTGSDATIFIELVGD